MYSLSTCGTVRILVIFISAFRKRVRSSGWLVEPKRHQKPEMGMKSFQTEEHKESMDQDKEVKTPTGVLDENRPHGNETGQVRKEPNFRNDVVAISSSNDRKISSIDSSGYNTNRSHRIDNNQGSSPVTSTNTVCHNSQNTSCNAANGTGQSKNNSYNSEHGTLNRKRNADYIQSSDVKYAWTHFTTRNPEKGRSELDKVSTVLRLKEIKCSNEPQHAAGSLTGESDENDNLRIREFESEQSVQLPGLRDLICNDGESGLDSGTIGETLQ